MYYKKFKNLEIKVRKTTTREKIVGIMTWTLIIGVAVYGLYKDK